MFFWAHSLTNFVSSPPQIVGHGTKSIKPWNITHKLPLRIPWQIFIYLHFFGPLGLQILCKNELIPQQSFSSNHGFSISMMMAFQALV
jgi:hypothetical protein